MLAITWVIAVVKLQYKTIHIVCNGLYYVALAGQSWSDIHLVVSCLGSYADSCARASLRTHLHITGLAVGQCTMVLFVYT